MVKFKIREKKSKRFKEISGIIEKSHDARLGIFNAKLAEIAAYHEFGTRDIPKRSIFRAWYDLNRQNIENDLRKAMTKIYKGADEDEIFFAMGTKWVKSIQKRIKGRIPPPLKDSTIKGKKGRYKTVPLIRTGQLLRSIEMQYLVTKKSNK